MKTQKNILKALAITATIALTSSVAMAHSDHDHSMVPFKWELSKNLKIKMVNQLKSNNPSLIGLTGFEQKKLNHYDIRVGNKFSTEAAGINFLMERTAGGIKIVGATHLEKVVYADRLPLKRINMISKVAINQKPHAGHNHAHLPYEWTFGAPTQEKILKAMTQNQTVVYAGLNHFEQSLLREYDIRPGNTFQTTIAGHKFLVEKTNSGLKVITHVEVENHAMVSNNNSNM